MQVTGEAKMYMISLHELACINYFLIWMMDTLLFRVIWSRLKKQTIYIDPSDYSFSYEYKKMWIAGFHLYVLIANHGLKKFLTIEEFTKPKNYKVLFLGWD
jgi:hypothetical protein